MTKFIVPILLSLTLAVSMVSADQPVALKDRKVAHFAASGSIVEVASRLARSVGGMASEESGSTAGVKRLPRPPAVSASADGKTIAEVMDALIAQDSRYTYVLFDEWINLIPVGLANDPNYLFNKRIPGGVTLSTDPSKSTSVSDWDRQNRVHGVLFAVGGDLRRSLPVPPQTVTLTNPTLREYESWRFKLAGKNYWFARCEPSKDGGVTVYESYSVIQGP